MAGKIKNLDNLIVAIEFVCPNTGNTVKMSSAASNYSPIKYEKEIVQYSEYTSDQFSWIDIQEKCPECGEYHKYDM